MRKISSLLVILALVLTGQSSASANSVVPTTVRVVSAEGLPVSGATIAVTGIPQAAQVTNAAGETLWSLNGGSTYWVTLDVRPTSNWTSPRNVFQVPISVTAGNGSQHVVKLPRVVNASLKLSDGEGFEAKILANLQPVRYFDVVLEVNGTPFSSRRQYGGWAPHLLEVVDTPSGKAVTVSFFEPAKLLRQDSSDVDGDLIPDIVFQFPTLSGPSNLTLLSRTLSTSPERPSLAGVTWVQATLHNEGVRLALMQGSKDISSTTPNGTFGFWSSPDVGDALVGRISGMKRASLNFSLLGPFNKPQSAVFDYSVNGVSLGVSSRLDFTIQAVFCIKRSSGATKSHATLGACPNGWLLVEPLQKLSEKGYASCAALNKALPWGVRRNNAVNVGKRLTFQPLLQARGYEKNRHLDADRDGIACER